MCGRFTSTEKKANIKKLFSNSKIVNYTNESYNVSPSDLINVVYESENNFLIDAFNWSYS